MAEYTYRQWENEMNEANNIHADDCYRWQAGIELAGGTWDGTWVDHDKTGKGLVTIDQFNALESQIQSKVSSYTPKNYDPDSTVQIVPGVDGWNKVEDGILKAVCTPDGVNRNWVQCSREFPSREAYKCIFTSFTRTVDEDGFGVMSSVCDGASTFTNHMLIGPLDMNDDKWAGKQCTMSLDIKANDLLTTANYYLCFSVRGTNNGTSVSYLSPVTTYRPNDAAVVDPDRLVNGEWCRFAVSFTMDTLANLTAGYSPEDYSYVAYVFSFRRSNIATNEEVSIKKMKFELADADTDWVDAPEDYGYPSATALSASPQSVENSDEVAAPEAEEIE